MTLFSTAKSIFLAATIGIVGLAVSAPALADHHNSKVYVTYDHDGQKVLRRGFVVYKGFPTYRTYNTGAARVTKSVDKAGVTTVRGAKPRHTKPRILVLK